MPGIEKVTSFRPRCSVFSEEERARLASLVRTVAAKHGLGVALTALWEQQKAMGFILGEPSAGENLADDSRVLCAQTGPYWLVHNPARRERKNTQFLTARGILCEHPTLVYERLEAGVYEHFPLKKEGFADVCFLCSAQSAMPNQVLVSMELSGAEFVYGANYATLGHSHFTLWTRVPILQRYWPGDTLLWLAEHGRRMASDQYATFFNGLGAGNSIKHFHFQTLREPFPLFRAAACGQSARSGIERLVWPMPAYRITLAPGSDPVEGLLPMDLFVLDWLAMDQPHSLNLILAARSDGTLDLVFVPRLDSPVTRRPRQLSNDFGGCEVGGRINIDRREEWEWARKQPESAIDDWLACLAPNQKKIAALEARL